MVEADDLEKLARTLDDDLHEWRSGLTVAERCDLAYYQGSGFFHVNRSLRGIADPPDTVVNQVASAIRNIDAAMERTALQRDLTVYRGVVDGPATLGMPLGDVTVGTAFRDDGYLSTSLDSEARREKLERRSRLSW